MSIVQKLHTLLRASARESAERITDANAIRIYRQEVMDAENLMQRRRTGLAAMIASRRDLERELAIARQRVLGREQEVAAISPAQRTQALLVVAAKDIAASQIHIDDMQQRLHSLVERINSEELLLRKLVSEIREHRCEIRTLAAQTRPAGVGVGRDYQHTVAASLSNLRETRASISTTVVNAGVAESSMAEAMERVDGDPVVRELAAQGRDQGSLLLAQVLQRLEALPGPAEPV